MQCDLTVIDHGTTPDNIFIRHNFTRATKTANFNIRPRLIHNFRIKFMNNTSQLLRTENSLFLQLSQN